jgi:hypothetical protein
VSRPCAEVDDNREASDRADKDYIRKVVDPAPTLTSEGIERIRALLSPTTGDADG